MPITNFKGGRAFQRERNRVSILLSLLRSQVSTSQVRSLLRVQQAADYWMRRRPPGETGTGVWIREFRRSLDQAYFSLEQGNFERRQLGHLFHLYGHLFRPSPGETRLSLPGDGQASEDSHGG